MNTNSKNETMDRQYLIFSGPSRDTLFDSCKYAYDKNAVIPIFFGVAEGYTAPLSDPGCAYAALEMSITKICGISHEDGSGVSFNIRGYCMVKFSNGRNEMKTCSFKAYYNARTRDGHISFQL